MNPTGDDENILSGHNPSILRDILSDLNGIEDELSYNILPLEEFQNNFFDPPKENNFQLSNFDKQTTYEIEYSNTSSSNKLSACIDHSMVQDENMVIPESVTNLHPFSSSSDGETYQTVSLNIPFSLERDVLQIGKIFFPYNYRW